MKRLKGTVIFIIIFLIILLIDFILYKNLDKIMPTYESKIYSFKDETQESQKEFLFEMYDQIEIQNSYRRYEKVDEEEIKNINGNDIVYNLLRGYIFKELEDTEFKELLMDTLYTAKLSNTIYGNFKIISNMYTDSDFIILYSEDISKIYYINAGEVFWNDYYSENKEEPEIVYEMSGIVADITDGEKGGISEYTKKGKEELVKEVQEVLFDIFKNYDFNPDTIIYKGSYYILKDSKKDITVCYNSNSNIILGLYMGFKK